MTILKNRFALLVALVSTAFTLSSAYYDDDSLAHSSLATRETDYDSYRLLGDFIRRNTDWDEMDGLIVRDHIERLYPRVVTGGTNPPAQAAGNQQGQAAGNPPAQGAVVQNPQAGHIGQGGNTPGVAHAHPHIPPLNLAGVGHAGQVQAQGQAGNAPGAAQANAAAATNGQPNVPRLNLAGVGRTRTDSIGSGTTLGNGDVQNPATRPKQPGMLSRAGQKVGSVFKSASRNRYEALNPDGPTDYAGMNKQQAKDYRKNYMLHHGGTSPRQRDYEAFRNNEAKEWNSRNADRVERAEGKKALYDKKHMKANFRLGAASSVVNAASAAGVIAGALNPLRRRSVNDDLVFAEGYLDARDADPKANMVDEDIWAKY